MDRQAMRPVDVIRPTGAELAQRLARRREEMERPPAKIPAGLSQIMTAREALETVNALDRMKPAVAPAPVPVSFSDILRAAAAEFGVDADALLKKRRTEPLATARNVAFLLCAELTGMGVSEIAGRFRRHHSMTTKMAMAIRARMEVDKQLSFRVERVRAALRGGTNGH